MIDYMVQPPASSAPEPPVPEADELGDGAPDVSVERREAVVPKSLHGQRLDKAVVTMAPEFSRSHLQGLIEGGHVGVDGEIGRAHV